MDLYRPVDELLKAVKANHTDAIITRWVCGITDRIAALGLPVVAYSYYGDEPNVTCVDTDNAAIGALAARHFMDRGLRSFAFIGLDFPYSRQRLAGFRSSLEAEGHTCADIQLPPHDEQYFEYLITPRPEFDRWLAKLPKPVGILSVFDKEAWRLVDSCRRQRLRIPDDVAVLGVNNDLMYCGLSTPPLSSVRIPWDRVGAAAAGALERILSQRSRARRLDAPELTAPEGIAVRESSDWIAVDDPVLSRALKVMQANVSEPLRIKDIAQRAFCSRRYLEMMFRTHLGRSPRMEQERLRMERAQELLRSTEQPVSIVAESCGYLYPERFSVAFKRSVGVTPTAFRRRHRRL